MRFFHEATLDLSIIMPCLNEETTVGLCVDRALSFIRKAKLKGEVLVVDNGSKDDSSRIAKLHGATVIWEPRQGYGRALRTGLACSRGRILLFGDCDLSYDFRKLFPFFLPLQKNRCDMVIGNRFHSSMEKGAIPVSHLWGVPMLSALGRLRYRIHVIDFHCGLRSMTRQAAKQMHLSCDGMEFATEMIAEAARLRLCVAQPKITLHRCPPNRQSKLRTIPDGLRHLKYILFHPL